MLGPGQRVQGQAAVGRQQWQGGARGGGPGASATTAWPLAPAPMYHELGCGATVVTHWGCTGAPQEQEQE